METNMSVTNTLGCVDTPIAGSPAIVNLPLAQLNFSEDFRVLEHSATKAVLASTKSPVDTIETIMVTVEPIPDIYKNSQIDESARFAGKQGVRIVSKVTDTVKVVDSAFPLEPKYAQVSAHIVIIGPDSVYFTPDMMKQLTGRCISSLFDTGSGTTTRLSDLQRKILIPSGVK